MSKATCTVDSCARGQIARGWCLMHYKRWRKWGSPTGGKPTELERFWMKVQKPEDLSDCWIWTSTRNHRGYGLFRVATTKQVSAHRYSYRLHFGDIPPDHCVCHACDNPSCVNPAHLWTGTQADNIYDRDSKGRHRNGHTGPIGQLG